MTLTDTALVVFIIAAVLHSVFVVACIVLLFIVTQRIKHTLDRLEELTAKGSQTIQQVRGSISSILIQFEAITQLLSLPGIKRLYERYKESQKERI